MRCQGRKISIIVFLFLGLLVSVMAHSDPSAAAKKVPPTTVVDHQARQARPILLGTSGGSLTDLANGYCCSGTLGALVKDANGVQYILSNTHVFAGDSEMGGNGRISQVGDAVNQPGYVDISCQNIATDYVANVSNWMEIIPNGTSVVDAAIAQVIPGAVDPQGRILEIGTISAQPRAAYLKQAVMKSGRTSGLTKGKVAGLNATVSIQYSSECAGTEYVSTFTGQILITPGAFLKGGDSGSLMVENIKTNPKPVGLLYAGSSQVAIANPIQEVLDTFGVTMVGTTSTSASSAPEVLAGQLKAADAKARNADRLMAVPGSIGHAVGLSKAGKPAIKVLVEKITSEAQTATPAFLDGVPVELWDVGKIIAY